MDLRRPVAGEYDLTWARADYEIYKALEWKTPPTGRSRMYFHDESVHVEGDTALVEVEVRMTFFGGDEVQGRQYQLRKVGKGWQITQTRIWPKLKVLGVERFTYDDERWMAYDEELAVDEGEKAITGLARTVTLVNAWRMKDAYTLAKSLAAPNEAGARDLQALLAWSALALELGKVDEAKEAVRLAWAIDPTANPPFRLRAVMSPPKR